MASNRRTGRFGRIVIALALVGLGGCGGEDRGTLEGVVKVNGVAVGPGAISLDPVDGSRAGALGSFGEDGAYTIIGGGRKPGALPGEYRVGIVGGKKFGAKPTGPQPPSKIPARYGDPVTSGLTVMIEPGQNTKDFELEP